MKAYILLGRLVEFDHTGLRQPDRAALQTHLNAALTIFRIVEDDF